MLKNLLEKKNQITVNFIGDSITCGMAHCHAEETYVARIAQMIARDFPEHTVVRYDGLSDATPRLTGFDKPVYVQIAGEKQVDIIKNGVNGSSVAFALNRLDQICGKMPNGRTADLAVMMFGINDALKSTPEKYVSAQVFSQNYKELIHKLRADTPDIQLVMITSSTNDQDITEHVKKTIEVAQEENIPLIDLNSLWNDHYSEQAPHFGHGDWLSDVSYDACHPSPLGALKSAEFIYERLL